MRKLAHADFLALIPASDNLIRQRLHRSQVALAFGRSNIYRSLGYLDLDVVAWMLCELLGESLNRTLAARVVRDQWGIWMRLVAQADASPERVFWYITTYTDAEGKTQHMTLGSLLDPDSPGALHAIASDIRARTGVTLQKYFCLDVTETLRRVRERAAEAGFDFSAPFLPAQGDALDELLQPFDDAMPDRAIVTAKHAERAGTTSRRLAEESIVRNARAALRERS